MHLLRSPFARSSAGLAAVEALAAVAVATGIVAALDTVAPITGLGGVYLLAVLLVAIRRGALAALGTAVASVLALNYFFIEPRHRLTIADSENVVALVVFLIAAAVVGRLATAARSRAAEAERRARESELLAAATSGVLAGHDLDAQLHEIAAGVAKAAGATHARIALEGAPTPASDELALRLSVPARPGWLYVSRDGSWDRDALERVAAPLAGLIDVALQRERLAAQAAEADAVRRADGVKTAVLHAVSHDLRSPLTAIVTAVGALGAGELAAGDRTDLIAVLQTESGRLSRLVDDLLDLSKIQASAVEPRSDWCDLHDTVTSAAAQVRARHGEHPVEFALRPDLPLVRADPAQLERVFANLLENAIRFSPAGEPVRVTGGVGGGYVTVRVIDRGRGIPPSQRTVVFEPFYRGRDAGQGSGLGLAICRGFVEANGGRILLQSDRDGAGTAFAVALPLVDQPEGAP